MAPSVAAEGTDCPKARNLYTKPRGRRVSTATEIAEGTITALSIARADRAVMLNSITRKRAQIAVLWVEIDDLTRHVAESEAARDEIQRTVTLADEFAARITMRRAASKARAA